MWRPAPTPASPDWADYFRQQQQHCANETLKRFYQAGVVEADTPLAEVPLLALDFETTGMDPARDAIVSIGTVPFNLDRIRPAAGRYWVIRPPRGLSAESIGIHHITHTEVASAPTLEMVLDEILEALAGHQIVVHFRNIERPFLDNAALRLLGEHCLFPLIDTMSIEASQLRLGWRARLKSFFGMRPASIRLADSRQRYGLPDYSLHHAKLDALATAELLQAQFRHHFEDTTPVGTLWV